MKNEKSRQITLDCLPAQMCLTQSTKMSLQIFHNLTSYRILITNQSLLKGATLLSYLKETDKRGDLYA